MIAAPIRKPAVQQPELIHLRRQYDLYKELDDVGEEDLSAFLSIYRRLRIAGVELPAHEVDAIEKFCRHEDKTSEGYDDDYSGWIR